MMIKYNIYIVSIASRLRFRPGHGAHGGAGAEVSGGATRGAALLSGWLRSLGVSGASIALMFIENIENIEKGITI